MWILIAPARITFLLQGSKLGPQATAKAMKMENVCLLKNHKRLLFEFGSHPPGSHFCHKDLSWDLKWKSKEWKWEMLVRLKNINDFYVNVDRTCQDHTFATVSKLGPQVTAKGMKMENVCWVKKHKRLLYEFLSHLSGSHFCNKDQSWDPKWQSKQWKWKMSAG